MHLLKYCIYFIDLFLNLLAASVAFMYTMSLLQIDNHLLLFAKYLVQYQRSCFTPYVLGVHTWKHAHVSSENILITSFWLSSYKKSWQIEPESEEAELNILRQYNFESVPDSLSQISCKWVTSSSSVSRGFSLILLHAAAEAFGVAASITSLASWRNVSSGG